MFSFFSPSPFWSNHSLWSWTKLRRFIGPGNKLALNLTHLITEKAMKPLRHWFRATPCQQDFLSHPEFVQNMVFGSLDVCLFLTPKMFYTFAPFSLFPPFFCCCNICFVALQETEMQKMKRVRISTVFRNTFSLLSFGRMWHNDNVVHQGSLAAAILLVTSGLVACLQTPKQPL